MDQVVSGFDSKLLMEVSGNSIYNLRLGSMYFVPNKSTIKNLYAEKNEIWESEPLIAECKSKSYNAEIDPETDILTGKKIEFDTPVYEINSGDTLLILAHETFSTASLKQAILNEQLQLTGLTVNLQLLSGPVVSKFVLSVQNPTSNRYYLRAGTIIAKVILDTTVPAVESEKLEEAFAEKVVFPTLQYLAL